MMDFHCHLDLYDEPEKVIEEAKAAGIYVLSVTTTPKAFPGTKKMAAASPRVRTALGLHPQLAAERHSELNLFDLMLPETAYVGEVGLDGSKEFKATLRQQSKAFRHILSSCDKHGGKVLSIHSRNAADNVLKHLSDQIGQSTPILHWFSGSVAAINKANEMNCWFSVGPAMLRTKSSRDKVRQMPVNRILLETDGPFAQLDGVPLKPTNAELCIPELARIWNFSNDGTQKQLLDNLRQIGEVASGSRSSVR